MKLYGSYTSPFVRHCRVALAQENIQAEFVEADFVTAAQDSPVAKVPFLRDGDLRLTDSSTILKYIREQAGRSFLGDINDHETFVMSSTVLDSAINVFLLELDGVGAAQSKYLARQGARVQSGLAALNERVQPQAGLAQDGTLRCACLLAWGVFRRRFELTQWPNLCGLLDAAGADENFAATAPPQ